MADPLLETRGERAEFKIGQPVVVSARCGDWGAGNRGRVACIADEFDPKGRHFIGVKMEGMPGHVGRPECKYLDYADAKDGAPPLPQFEAGLVEPVKA